MDCMYFYNQNLKNGTPKHLKITLERSNAANRFD